MRGGLPVGATLARTSASLAGVALLIAFAGWVDSDAYQLSFRIPRAALAQVVPADSPLLDEALGMSQYAWMAIVPIALGVLSVIACALRSRSSSSSATCSSPPPRGPLSALLQSFLGS